MRYLYILDHRAPRASKLVQNLIVRRGAGARATYLGHARKSKKLAKARDLPHKGQNHWEKVAGVTVAAYPNKFKNPTVSTIMPKIVQRIKTSAMPAKKQMVPRSFSLRAKNRSVF